MRTWLRFAVSGCANRAKEDRMIIRSDPVNAFLIMATWRSPRRRAGRSHGLTFAVKDIFDVAGYPTGGGNPIRRAESPIHTTNAPIVAGHARCRRALRRQDADRRADVFDERPEQAFSRAGQRRAPRAASPAARPPARPRRSPQGSAISPSAPTPAARCARRRAIAGSGASARRMGASTIRRAMPLAPSFDTAGYFADEPDDLRTRRAGFPRRGRASRSS